MEKFLIDKGSPLFIYSDNAKAMESKEMIKIILCEKIKQKFTEPHYQTQNRAE